ncbi:MAG TPA: hypothetical protein VN628_06980, partial [Vicinamibacterales bacterium]|nr:hypothetical protein [Vicinamibacterales bacterium]
MDIRLSFAQLGPSGWFICAVMSAWFVLTVLHQLTSRAGDWIKKKNLMALIPAWTFFAPTPGMTDYRLVVRDRRADGFGEWREIEWCRPRRLIDALWHPARHRTKLVVDCVTAFIRTIQEMSKLGMIAERDQPSWMISVPYMALLNVAQLATTPAPDTTGLQFAVIEVSPSDPATPPRLIVCSSP